MACELCTRPGGEILWSDGRLRVVLVDEPDYTGFCRVIWKAHVAEMTDLAPDERQHVMNVVFAVEALLRRTLAPCKINLASLGNFVPHVHWHVIPRYPDDPHFPQPVWSAPQRSGAARPSFDTRAFAAALETTLGAGQP